MSAKQFRVQLEPWSLRNALDQQSGGSFSECRLARPSAQICAIIFGAGHKFFAILHGSEHLEPHVVDVLYNSCLEYVVSTDKRLCEA